MQLLIMQFSPASCHFISLWAKYCILLSTLFSNTVILLHFLSLRGQISRPYKITGKIIDLCIL
jgi:hypothetical protein